MKPAGVCYVSTGREEVSRKASDRCYTRLDKTATLLRDKGFHTVADIQRASVVQMSALLGKLDCTLAGLPTAEDPTN